VDETGDRSIGVLTKPDLINPGGEEEVRRQGIQRRFAGYSQSQQEKRIHQGFR
jgi:hypothetical protein